MQFKHLASAIILASLTACGGGGSSSNLEVLKQGLTNFQFDDYSSVSDSTTVRKSTIKWTNNSLGTDSEYEFVNNQWKLKQYTDTERKTEQLISENGEFYEITPNTSVQAKQSSKDKNALVLAVENRPPVTMIKVIDKKNLSGQTVSDYFLNLPSAGLFNTDKKKIWLKEMSDKTFSDNAVSYKFEPHAIVKNYNITNYADRLKTQTFSSLKDDHIYNISGRYISINKTDKTISIYSSNNIKEKRGTYKYTTTQAGSLNVYEFDSDNYKSDKDALIEYAGDILLSEFIVVGEARGITMLNKQASTDVDDWLNSADADHQLPKDLNKL